ncbi:MAG TPA: tetratricopeptide repeat protein, partial [Burkholderiales bacterium]|nr:tetratricopeptide repeat protein [Burkholderiales bacterium]
MTLHALLLAAAATMVSGAAFALNDAELGALAKQAASGSAPASAEIQRRAAGGDAQAEHLMGMMHVSGQGAAQSDELAVDWFLRAARKGDVPSQHNLGVIYERSAGPLKDPEEARRWYLSAAAQGYARSRAKIGAFHLDGVGVPTNTD